MPTPTFDGDVYQDGQQFKDDAKLAVRFYMRAIHHEFNSLAEGRPVYIEVPYVEILTPGSRDTLVTEATEQYQKRFAAQWRNFIAREEAPMEGTPLAEIPWMSKSQVAELAAINVKTIEQLIAMPDVLANKIMGMATIRMRAQRFLEAAKGEGEIGKMEQEINDLKFQNSQLVESIAAMKAQLNELTKKAKP